MSVILLSLVILLSPFSPNYPLVHDAAIGFCVLAAGYKLITQKELRKNTLLPLLGFLLLSAILAVYQSIDLKAACKDIAQMFCLCTLATLSLSLNSTSQKVIVQLLRCVFICTLGLGIFGLIINQQQQVWPFRNNYIYAVTLLLTFPFILFWLNGKRKYLMYLIAPLCVFVIPLSVCLILSASTICVAIIIKKQRKLTLSFAALIIICCSIAYYANGNYLSQRGLNDLQTEEGSDISQRYIEWAVAGRVWAAHPVSGVGGGNYQKYIAKEYETLPKSNLMPAGGQCGWLVLAIEYGIGGVLSFTAILLLSIKTIINRHKDNDNSVQDPALLLSMILTFFCGIFTLLITRETGPLLFILIGLSLCAQPTQTKQNQ